MQLEAKMKQRFSWTALLLLTACLVRSSLADERCNSNGIVGTFSQPEGSGSTLDSLTITPVDYKDTLIATISKADKEDLSVQIYMTVADDSDCKTGGFKVINADSGKVCTFNYGIENKEITVKDKGGTVIAGSTYVLDYNDPYQASFELQTDASGKVTKMAALISSGDEVDLTKDMDSDCLQIVDGAPKFNLTFGDDFKGKECGVQFEMKGKYEVTALLKDTENCTLEPPGSSNDGGTEDPNQPGDKTTAAPQPTTAGFPVWAWGAIGGGVVVLIIIIIVVVLIIYCFCFKKKKGGDEDVEAAPEEEPDIPPTDSTVTGADQSGVDPTQQTPNGKPEDNAEDKPEDKTEDKPEDE